MFCDLHNKIILVLLFNIPFYFMANLRRTASAFFTFCLFAFMVLLTGSMFYRALGAVSRTLSESIAPGSVFAILLIIYTGFVLPIQYMHPWLRWFGYINHISYAFESLMVNKVRTSFPSVSAELILVSFSFLDASSHVRLLSQKGQVTVI